MAQVVLYGPNGDPLYPQTPAKVEPTYAALRTTLKPNEYKHPGQTLGHYKMAFTWTCTTNTTTTPILSLQWAPANSALMIPLRIKLTHMILTTVFTTQQLVDVAVTIARGYTVADTGGTAVTFPGNSQKTRTSMGKTLLTDLRTNAGSAIAAGTRAADTNPFAQVAADIASNTLAVGGTPLLTSPKDLYVHLPGAEHPLVLAQNEGLIFNSPASIGAVGTVKFGVQLEWLEAFDY